MINVSRTINFAGIADAGKDFHTTGNIDWWRRMLY
jgi:hypothetical protein